MSFASKKPVIGISYWRISMIFFVITGNLHKYDDDVNLPTKNIINNTCVCVYLQFLINKLISLFLHSMSYVCI